MPIKSTFHLNSKKNAAAPGDKWPSWQREAVLLFSPKFCLTSNAVRKSNVLAQLKLSRVSEGKLALFGRGPSRTHYAAIKGTRGSKTPNAGREINGPRKCMWRKARQYETLGSLASPNFPGSFCIMAPSMCGRKVKNLWKFKWLRDRDSPISIMDRESSIVSPKLSFMNIEEWTIWVTNIKYNPWGRYINL